VSSNANIIKISSVEPEICGFEVLYHGNISQGLLQKHDLSILKRKIFSQK